MPTQVAKAAATSGVKAGAAAISAAAANFEALQAQLTRSMAFGARAGRGQRDRISVLECSVSYKDMA